MASINWWQKHEAISRLQGYFPSDFEWNLNFKPVHRYLGTEYPLDTTCWYVHFEACGQVQNICADSAALAIDEAIPVLVQAIESSIWQWENRLNDYTPFPYQQLEWRELLEKLKEVIKETE